MSVEDDGTTQQADRRQIRCKAFGCSRKIIFLPTGNGNMVPVDAETVLPSDTGYDPPRHVLHSVSCPGANKYRRDRT